MDEAVREARQLLQDHYSGEYRRPISDTGELTVYVSGPMRGYTNYNYDTFNAVAEELVNGIEGIVESCIVYNPADNFDGDQSLGYETYMREDLAQVLKCDAIVLLPGWEMSEGAKLELKVAQHAGLQVFLARRDCVSRWYFEAQADVPAVSEGIEETARRIVYGERNETYGPPRNDFSVIGRIWSAILEIDVITPEQVAIMMTGLKLARLAKSPDHKDSRVDVIGYQLCLDRLVEEA